MTATAAPRKVRYFSTETNKIAWALPDDLPGYALEQDGVKQQLGLLPDAEVMRRAHEAKQPEPETPAPVADDGPKVRFSSPDAGRMVYKSWGQMTENERAYVRAEVPSAVPDSERSGDVGRYSDLIEYYEDRMKQAQRVVREGRDGIERGHAAGAVPQFRLAIEILREAETIDEPADCWFAVVPGELKTRIPPSLSGPYQNDMERDWVVKTQNHVTRLSNPIHIAWMRRLVRQGDPAGDRYVFEKPINPTIDIGEQSLYPFIDPDSGELIAWGTRDEFFRGVSANRFRE